MGMVKFRLDDTLKSIVAHAVSASEQASNYGEPIKEPSLFLVHDDGIYLMSAGKPSQENPDKSKGSTALLVAYAEGCDPRTAGDDCWDHCRTLVGGDDFGEPIPAKSFVEAIAKGATACHINWGARKYTIEFKYPGVPAQAAAARQTPGYEPGKPLPGFSKEIAGMVRKELDIALAVVVTKYGLHIQLGKGTFSSDTLKFPLELVCGGKTPAERDYLDAVAAGLLPGYTADDLGKPIKTRSRDFVLAGFQKRSRRMPMLIKDPVAGSLHIMSAADALKGLRAAAAKPTA
jgi:hypothetical protein